MTKSSDTTLSSKVTGFYHVGVTLDACKEYLDVTSRLLALRILKVYSKKRYASKSLGIYGVTSQHIPLIATRRSHSVTQIKCLSNTSKSSIRHLIACGYHYDAKLGEWSRGRLKFEEWRVTETVILYLRENYPEITEKGVFASEIIEEAKHTPQITLTKGFIERYKEMFGIGHRISGKAIFALWCEETGTDIEDDVELFLKRKSLIINKVYDRLSMVCRWLGRKRINGSVKRNVFVFGDEPLAPIVPVARRSDPTAGLQDLTAAPMIRPAG